MSAGRIEIKVCGVTRPEDAVLATDLGADYLGLNFHRPSPRFVEVARAREIAAAVRGRVLLVGVFVDRPAAEVEEVAERVGLDRVQFHGDEGPEEVAPFAARAIKAFRGGGDPGREALARYGAVWGLLFDAPHPALYGGTGEAWDFGGIAGLAGAGPPGRRVFVAGGIGPDNVRRALAASGAGAVDVCSRVESAPGIKDAALLARLFEEVRHGQVPTPARR